MEMTELNRWLVLPYRGLLGETIAMGDEIRQKVANGWKADRAVLRVPLFVRW